MATLLCTIWALLLNTVGVTIFQTCFANSMEDEDGEPLLSGPPVTSFLFAAGVYTVIIKFNLFPQSLRRPKSMVLFLYEFLVTAFLLEFAVACIWTPVDILILTTIPKTLCKLLCLAGLNDWGDILLNNKSPVALLSYVVALAFFFLTLHVTRSVDFTVFTANCPVKGYDVTERVVDADRTALGAEVATPVEANILNSNDSSTFNIEVN